MSERFQADVMEDMLAEATEGPAQTGFDAGEDGGDSWEGGEDEGDEFLGVIGGAGGAQAADEYEDTGDDGFEGDAGYDEVDAASLEDAVADAMEEEDADEFFRRLRRIARGAVNVARGVGRGIGQVARVAAPILSAIPLPQAQALGRIAGVAGRLLADGADEFEAIDTLVESYDDSAIDAAAPLIAGMALRRVMPQISTLPRQARRQLVRSTSQAVRVLVRRQGAPAARAAARILQTAQRAVRQRQMAPRAVPQAVRRAAQRVAQTPRAVQRLARPLSPAGASGAIAGPRYGTGYPAATTRRIVLQGPATITISVGRRFRGV
jgi:hypothetical protein